MVNSIGKTYLFGKDFDITIFEGNDEQADKQLGKYGLSYIDIHYEDALDNPELWTSYWHHDSGTSLIVQGEGRNINLVGLEGMITQTLKDIKPLTGELTEVK